jgi:hypothetical protein
MPLTLLVQDKIGAEKTDSYGVNQDRRLIQYLVNSSSIRDS